MPRRNAFLFACCLIVGCGENAAPPVKPPIESAVPTYLVVNKVNGKPSSGTTFRKGDTIQFEGRFEIDDDRESVAPLLVEIVKTRSDIGEVQSNWILTDSPEPDGPRAFTYRGKIEIVCRPGKATLRCTIPYHDPPVVVGSMQLNVIE